MSATRLTDDDEGKRVVAANGSELGMLAEVREGVPYVETNPNVVEKLEAEFDVGELDDDVYPLKTADVAEVSEDEVRLA